MVVSKAPFFMKVVWSSCWRSWEPSAAVKMSRTEVSACTGVAQWKLRLPVQFYTISRHHSIPPVWATWVRDGHSFSPKKSFCGGCQALSHASWGNCARELLTHPSGGITGICHSGAFRTSSFHDFCNAQSQGRGGILAVCHQWIFSSNLRICSLCE